MKRDMNFDKYMYIYIMWCFFEGAHTETDMI